MFDEVDDGPRLTAGDLVALKEAQTIVAFWRPDGSEGPTSGLRLCQDIRLNNDKIGQDVSRIEKRGIWTRDSLDEWGIYYKRIITAGIVPDITIYAGGGDQGSSVAHEAVGLFSSSRYHPSIQSVVNILKVGDKIGVVFVGNNNNENLTKLGWCRDELSLRVHRKEKRVGTFLLDVYVGPNNTTRMIH